MFLFALESNATATTWLTVLEAWASLKSVRKNGSVVVIGGTHEYTVRIANRGKEALLYGSFLLMIYRRWCQYGGQYKQASEYTSRNERL